MTDFYELETRIGYEFKDKGLLTLAFTHISTGEPNSERLEFLGDGVLDMLVAEYLYLRYPDYQEGRLTEMRARIVSRAPLAEVYDDLALGNYLHTFNLSIKTLSIKARSNVVESLLGAIYLDGGLGAARHFIELFVIGRQAKIDYKSRLIEWCTAKRYTFSMETIDIGDVHTPYFSSTAIVGGKKVARGQGKNKREAEQQASKEASKLLGVVQD